MIEYIKGTIAELTPARMVLECYGIGYEINISLTTFSAFQGKDECKVFIYEVIREDAHLLFGFAEPVERELFLLLTSVSGVGPNTARMILSSLQPAELIRVIATRDDRSLTAVKGIGTKTAERIGVDLKNKVKQVEGLVAADTSVVQRMTTASSEVAEEAVAALVMLGFQKAASQKVVTAILKEDPAMAVEKVVKEGLKRL